MSASLSWAAKPCMIGFLRLPSLNSWSCLTRYSGCCAASLGWAGTDELPSAPWQAAQTAVYLASPCARSGLARAAPAVGAGAGAAAEAVPTGAPAEGASPLAAAPAGAPAAVGAASAATTGKADTASAAAVSKEASSFISRVCVMGAKPGDSTMGPSRGNPCSVPRAMTDTPLVSPSTGATDAVATPPAADGKTAMGWMHTARFLTTAAQLHHLPPLHLPEIAFVGRSNAGKSTCINTLTQQKQLAFASKKPGRTQHINLFSLGKQGVHDAVLADLPGYGYAAVPKADKVRWQRVMANYLVTRENLTGVVLLCDPRHGLTELDEILLDVIRPRVAEGLKFLVLLTKADKLTRVEGTKALQIAKLNAGGGEVQLFSALKKQGVDEAALRLWHWAHPPGGFVSNVEDRPEAQDEVPEELPDAD